MNDLLRQAQQLGIKIYIDNGQVKITLPWPLESAPETARQVLAQLRTRQTEVLTALDPAQAKHWEAMLANTKHLRAPVNGRFEPMTALHGILLELSRKGAYLTREERTLRLIQGTVSGMVWEHLQASIAPYTEQLNWVLRLSVMGAAREYVNLAPACPKEWIADILGKHGARIAEFRGELMGKERCFELPDGRRYWLVPCKTGRERTEITPEEAVIIAEAQDSGLLTTEPEGAWHWIKEEL